MADLQNRRRRFPIACIPTALMLTMVSTALAQPVTPPAPAAPAPAAPAPAPAAPAPAAAAPPADTAKPDAKAIDEVAPPSEAAKQEARARFEKGLSLLQEEAWAAALAEFLASRELYPTRSATTNAAIALRKLQRYDESLDLYEKLLRDFPNVPAAERAVAQRAITELRDLVGTIELEGAEPGAAIVISGQNRGEYPPVTPIRVSAGTHLVRVVKEGFEPFETRADVAGGQTARVDVKLRVLKAAGRLRVKEQSGQSLDVVVDNVVVGRTPWEGLVGVGEHTVMLRGEGKIGSVPSLAPVKVQELTALTLAAEELDASMRVDPTPVSAEVTIDSIPLGHGAWIGRLKSGPHRVQVSAGGFIPAVRSVNLTRGGREIVKVQLEVDPAAEIWRKPSKWVLDATVDAALAPSFGGNLSTSCGGGCSSSLGAGGLAMFHASYELGTGLGVGLAAGYLALLQSTDGRTASLTPKGLGPRPGTANDSLRLGAFVGGATVSQHFGERFPALLRLGAGVMVGRLRDERTGTFESRAGAAYSPFPVANFSGATYFYIDPEARLGIRLNNHIEIGAGIQALLLIGITTPRWHDQSPKNMVSTPDGVAAYPAESQMGRFFVALAPGLDARYDF